MQEKLELNQIDNGKILVTSRAELSQPAVTTTSCAQLRQIVEEKKSSRICGRRIKVI